MQDVIACARRAGAHRAAFICFAAFAAFASFRDARARARVPARVARRRAACVAAAPPGAAGLLARGRVAEKTSAAGRKRIARLPSEFRVNGCPNR
ncbi:hypothetical protein BGI52_06255 [Burkholderia pseudomallei]|nr:hypothetical protein BGI49_06255 [Burkholderia pseudomallei]APZ12202.1 hypothetical protein BGI52_06255 [Burkholderia pseudomallei]